MEVTSGSGGFSDIFVGLKLNVIHPKKCQIVEAAADSQPSVDEAPLVTLSPLKVTFPSEVWLTRPDAAPLRQCQEAEQLWQGRL